MTYLNSIADGDDEIVIELINIFLEQIDEFTEKLDRFFYEKNWRGVAALAHKAKSSVISMGMEEMGNKDLKNLELIAKFFTIEELHNKKELTVKEQDELILLKKSLSNYPQNRQNWVVENATEDTASFIINKFKDICQQAENELRIFLERI
ncbi:MAG: hypothetical protein LBV41_03080 [Cytophagaceae bacterium]|nr:hypothetical protein [Cytophagaceae bacterium]